MSVLGLRTAIYKVPDLAKAKAWYSAAFGVQPYFDEPFYVGYQIGGFELGLDPDPEKKFQGMGGSHPYWGVDKIEDGLKQFVDAGAKVFTDIQDVGQGIRVATVTDPFGNLIGLIENPNFGKS